MIVNGFNLNPLCVLFRTTTDEMEKMFKQLIYRKTHVKTPLSVYLDDETLSVAVEIDPDELLDEEDYDKICMAGYNPQEHYLAANKLLLDLFGSTDSRISAAGVAYDDPTVFIEIPVEIYEELADNELSNDSPLWDAIDLGEFDITSGTVIVSDPCYSLGTWCQGKLENVKKGKWMAFCHKADIEHWGNRVTVLTAMHKDLYISKDGTEIEMIPLNFNIGVDSGQCGIFDIDVFKNNNAVFHVDNPDKQKDLGFEDEPWYEQCCHITLSDLGAGVVPGGTVSSSGFGDGSYTCYVAYEDGDPDKQIIGISIEYISPEEIAGIDEDELEEADPYIDEEERF